MVKPGWKKYIADKELLEKGVWLDYGFEDNIPDGFRIRVLRVCSSNAKYQEELKKSLKPYKAKLIAKLMTELDWEDVRIEAFSHSCFLTWEGPGMIDENGNPLDATPENFQMIMKQARDLFSDAIFGIYSKACMLETFRIDEDSELAKK